MSATALLLALVVLITAIPSAANGRSLVYVKHSGRILLTSTRYGIRPVGHLSTKTGTASPIEVDWLDDRGDVIANHRLFENFRFVRVPGTSCSLAPATINDARAVTLTGYPCGAYPYSRRYGGDGCPGSSVAVSQRRRGRWRTHGLETPPPHQIFDCTHNMLAVGPKLQVVGQGAAFCSHCPWVYVWVSHRDGSYGKPHALSPRSRAHLGQVLAATYIGRHLVAASGFEKYGGSLHLFVWLNKGRSQWATVRARGYGQVCWFSHSAGIAYLNWYAARNREWSAARVTVTPGGGVQLGHAAQIHDLGWPSAQAIAAGTQYEVGYPSGPQHWHATLYEDGTKTELNRLLLPDSGWSHLAPWAANNRGQIAGIGYFRSRERVFLMTPERG